MPVDHKLPTIYFKKRAIINFDKIYHAVFMWLEERKYQCRHEELYKLKGSDGEWDIHGDKKIGDYVKYHIDIKFQTWDMKDIEVMKGDKKVRMTDVKLKVSINGKAETDWQERFEHSKFQETLRKFYEKYIIKKKIEDLWEFEVYKEMYDIRDKLIHLLEMETHR